VGRRDTHPTVETVSLTATAVCATRPDPRSTASPLIPRTHYLLGRLFKDAGLPDGVLNVIQLDESTVAADVERVIGDDRVRMVNFTGSETVGKRIGELAGRHCKYIHSTLPLLDGSSADPGRRNASQACPA
jgi:hypothetical protein